MAECKHDAVSIYASGFIKANQTRQEMGFVCKDCNKTVKFTKTLLKRIMNNGI